MERTRAALAATCGRGRAGASSGCSRPPGWTRETAVIRWGNFDGTLVLSSGVFEPDDSGRSYRFRPGDPLDLVHRRDRCRGPCASSRCPTRRRPATPSGRPGRHRARVGPGDQLVGVPGPRARHQGPAPRDRAGGFRDPGRARRRRPDAARLPRARARRGGPASGRRCSMRGCSGTRPSSIITPSSASPSGCPPSSSSWGSAAMTSATGAIPADWEEACYWLERILQFCRTRRIACLFVPWPGEDALLAIRDESIYPGPGHAPHEAGRRQLLLPDRGASPTRTCGSAQAWEKAGKPANHQPAL